jgi:NADPH2:quinone reductase
VTTSRELHSLVRPDATLELRLDEVAIPVPADHEVVVRVEGTPISPSDLALLLAFADPGTASASVDERGVPVTTMPLTPGVMKALQGRLGEAMPVGNEGCGTVVAAGTSAPAQALLGRRVSFAGGGAYADHRAVAAAACLPLPADASPAEGAASFVNPMTALAMVETMRAEGHTALVHTAAASALGQMLVRVCLADGVPLVNVVRREEQADLLRDLGAEHVVVSGRESFADDLAAAVSATGATLAFDAVGGGRLASRLLSAMERSASASGPYSRYGSEVHKQVYIYGSLDPSPTELVRSFGLTWGVGGWLLMPRLGQLGRETVGRLRARVAEELTTTFATTYGAEITLQQVLDPAAIVDYAAQRTGGKHLVRPDRG